MASNNISKPRYTFGQWFRFIALRVIFPPVLLLDLIRFVVNRLVGKALGKKHMLPSQGLSKYDPHDLTPPGNPPPDKYKIYLGRYRKTNKKAWEDKDATYNDTESLTHHFRSVTTHDGVVLDTLEVKHHTQKAQHPANQKYLIHFLGNDSCYEEIASEMRDDANALECNVVGFNFRGVMRSGLSVDENGAIILDKNRKPVIQRPRSTQDLFIDGVAQVQSLLDSGVSADNIVIKGHSMGAGIACLVTEHFHRQGQPIYLFNDRSYSSVTNTVVAKIETGTKDTSTGHHRRVPGVILGTLAKPFIKFLFYITKWEVNAARAFKNIPKSHREYMLIHTPKAARNQLSDVKDDLNIPHAASLHKALWWERLFNQAEKDKARARKMQTKDPAEAGHARHLEVGRAKVSENTTEESNVRVFEETGQAFFHCFARKSFEHENDQAESANLRK